MAYMALYRKYRPASFAEVRGQDAVITALRNQVKLGRVGHAYLFCGTRGTGKTTVAKILARAVNCENPQDGSPCGKCGTCEAIADGSSLNVIEIDAASNNGVDNIREIREEVAYAPTDGKYKVYIIDEVHMLSPGAYNALLKTLEEPPSYVIFILATTEVNKIPLTIQSRCQRYDFRRISADTIADCISGILKNERIEAEEKAVRYIAGAADGSMRDALSLLDQCIAYYPDEPLSYDHVLEILGAVDITVFSRLFEGIVKSDTEACLSVLDEAVNEGRELTQFTVDFTWFLRNLMMTLGAEHPEEVLEVTAENLEIFKKEAKITDMEQLFRLIRIFSDLGNQIRFAGQKRILMEVALIKMCRPQMEADTESLAERIRILENKAERLQVLEDKLESGEFQPASGGPAAYAAAGSASGPEKDPGRRAKPVLPAAVPDDVRTVVGHFRSYAAEMDPLYHPYMKDAKLSLSKDGNLLMVFSSVLNREAMERRKEQLESFISSKAGKTIHIEFADLKENEDFDNIFVNLEKVIKMPVIVEDEPDEQK